MLNLIVVLTAISQVLIALFVYQKKRNSVSNIAFSLLILASLAWSLTNYVYTLDPVSSSALFEVRLVLFWVVIQNTAFYVFAKNYPSSTLVISQRKLKVVLIFSAFVAAATLSPYVFASVSVASGQSNPNPSFLIPLFMLHAVYTIGTGLTSLVKKMQKSYSQQRRQLKFILFASVLNWVVVPLTNFIITLVFHTTFFAKVSPIYSLAFASIIAYAMVAQKLFDIRAAVARSVAYLFSLAIIGIVYGSLVLGVLNNTSLNISITTERILFVGFALITAVAYPATKRFFDRITTKLFYKDAYDIQEVLDELGGIIVAEIDLHKVLHGTRQVLAASLKSSFIEFILIKEEMPYVVPLDNKTLQTSLKELSSHMKEQHRELLIVDELGSQHILQQAFTKSGVAASLQLKTRHQVVGYVLFGDKLSGDSYNPQDKRLLTIVADELAIAVQNALRFEEIEKFNITLQEKINDATKKLRHTNEKLKALDETKDEFISMASHQLRTPLTAVKGYVSMVLEGDVGRVDPKQKEMLEQAFMSAQRMVYLIADLLNVSRLKTGKFIIQRRPTQLADVIESEITQLKTTAKGRNLELAYDKPKGFPELMLDETKIRQVIMNFADNAIYYTPPGGHIRLGLVDKESSVEFTVSDDGIGVPKAQQHNLFTKFYRAGNAQKARPDGTGLGLFMAKKVVVAQGGAIIFHSEEGKGSTFGFSFPKTKELTDVKEVPAGSFSPLQ